MPFKQCWIHKDLSWGDEVQNFEDNVAKYCNCKHAIGDDNYQ
jgi:dTDP-4-amino-4,6-dideoxygalactose transaminase